MHRTARPFLCILSLTIGCEAFPYKVDDLPPFERYPITGTLNESDVTDFPPAATEDGDIVLYEQPLEEKDSTVVLGDLFSAVKVTGELESVYLSIGEPIEDDFVAGAPCDDPDAQPTDIMGFSKLYSGDVDTFLVEFDTGGLCILLAPDGAETSASIWDVFVYPYDATQHCYSGGAVSLADESGTPVSIPMPGTQVAIADAGQYVIVIASTSPSDGEPLPYALYLLPTRDSPNSCRVDLSTDDFSGEP